MKAVRTQTNPATCTPQMLLDRARAGDPATGDWLYDRYWTDVNRMVWSLLGRDAEHDDVVSEVFVRLLQGITKVRDPDRLRPWVMTVTVHTVRTELRQRMRRRKLHLTDRVEPLAKVTDDHSGKALLRKTFAVLDRLPTEERLAFHLRHIEQRGLDDVAELCACSWSTAKRRIARAEKRFAAMAKRDPALRERLMYGTQGEGQ